MIPASSAELSESRLNWLRAAVLGANDGIVSVASIVLGVVGATSSWHTIFIAGVAGLTAGAFSMAVGEYVSVSAQRDAERAFSRGKQTALSAISRRLERNDFVNPWHAAFASFISFIVGGIVPLIAVSAAPAPIRVAVTFIAVLCALAITGFISATAGNASRARAMVRVIAGGAIAMAATYGIGYAFGFIIH